MVYFIQGKTTKLVKIGRTNNVDLRLAALRSHSPDELELIGVATAEQETELEQGLHLYFAANRIHGEWFRLSPEMATIIDALTKGAAIWRDRIAESITQTKTQTLSDALPFPDGGINFKTEIERVEKYYVQQAIDRAKGVRAGAASLLKITYRSLRHYVKKHGLDKRKGREG